jgi:outer membrane protein OmpA-like peptidoglycan-associated protein
LKNILDGEYESFAEGHGDEQDINIGGDPFVLNPYVSGAVGLRYKLGKRTEIELEHRFVWTNDDLLDGQRWTEHGGVVNSNSNVSAMTRDMDMYNLTSIGIHFRLGKGVESAWWTNPVAGMYSEVAETKKLVNQLTDDRDGDGVPDLYDKEPDTPEGTPVDPSGQALDSDGDGVADNDDIEPFSPKGADVDGQGRAVDSDNDGVPDAFDKEPNSPPGMYYDSKGVAIVFPAGQNDPLETQCLLPIIYFDLDKDNIKPEFYPELYYIAQVMRANPDLKVRATGHTDNRNTDSYNQDLSMRRVNNAVEFLSSTYGIAADRFLTGYNGEEQPVIADLPDTGNRKFEALHYVNRRVEFECVK